VEHLISIVGHAVDTCILMNCGLYTFHSIPCMSLLLLRVSRSYLSAKDGRLESKSKTNLVNGFIGLSTQLGFFNCKGFGLMSRTPVPSN
jgi:hypothetical protein